MFTHELSFWLSPSMARSPLIGAAITGSAPAVVCRGRDPCLVLPLSPIGKGVPCNPNDFCDLLAAV